MHNRGSSLIFVSLVMAFAGIILILCTRNSLLYYGFTIERMHHLRSRYALEALAQYGIAYCIASKKTAEKEHIKKFKQWPPPAGPYQGQIKISGKNNPYFVNSTIFYQKEQLGKVSCSVHIVSEQEVFIDNWSYGG